MKTIHLLLAATCITCYSCIKKVPVNILTTVNGTVWDPVKNKNLKNARVVVRECANLVLYGISCAHEIDSARSDSNGGFKFSFRSDGKYVDYEVMVSYDENFDLSVPVKLIAGQVNNITIQTRELNYLRSHITMTQNPFGQMVSLSRNTRHVFPGTFCDTVVYHKVLPNALNQIIYSVWDTNLGKYRMLIDTLQTGMIDTTNYTRILPNTNSFPVH
jgi:hypothetical protein